MFYVTHSVLGLNGLLHYNLSLEAKLMYIVTDVYSFG